MSIIEKRKKHFHNFIKGSGLINKPPWHRLIDDIYFCLESDLRKKIDGHSCKDCFARWASCKECYKEWIEQKIFGSKKEVK